MDHVLLGMQGTELFVYLDDIIIYAKTHEEHEDKVLRIYKRLSKAGLRLQIDKCEFLTPEVTYLGRKIGSYGVRPHPGKGVSGCYIRSPVFQTLSVWSHLHPLRGS